MSFLLKKWAQLSQKQKNLIHFAGRVISIIVAGINLIGLVTIWFPAAIQRALFFPRSLPIDYRDYYQALQNLQSGAPLYAGGGLAGGYLYPPPFLVFIYPLGQFDEATFMRVLLCLLFVAFFVYAWCLARIACTRPRWHHVMLACFVLTLWPGQIQAMSNGNFQPVLTALWGLAYACRASQVRAIALSLSAIVKIHTVLPLAVAFFDEGQSAGWRSALRKIGVPSFLTFLFLIMAGGWLCGWGSYAEWMNTVPARISGGTFYFWNVSPSVGVLRLLRALGWWHYPGGALTAGPRLFLLLCSVGGPLLVWWLMRRRSPELRQTCVGSAVVLLAPLCWTYYLPILLVPLAFCLRETCDNFQKNRLDSVG